MSTTTNSPSADISLPSLDDLLSHFAADLKYENLADDVIESIRRLFIDTVGVTLAGGLEEHARQAGEVAAALAGAEQATILGSGVRTSVAEAAFANGVAAHSIDFDDTHRFVHPGCAVVPAALAIAEWRSVSGKDLIASLAAGYEISIRVAFAGGAKHRKNGYHPTGTCNVFGAAAAASRALGLDKVQTRSALGIACSMASGITQYRLDGSANKHLHAGLAARSGVLAALLAQRGFRGTSGGLDGELGFLSIYADLENVSYLTEGLGKRFHLTETDIKTYPSCRQSHASIDLALQARQQLQLTPETVDQIDIGIYTYADRPWYTSNEAPATPLEAMLRIPYCVAAALTFGEVNLPQFADTALHDEKLRALLPRIHVTGDTLLDAQWPAERRVNFTCTTTDGRTVTLSAGNPRGGSDNPLSNDDVIQKFRGLAQNLLGQNKSDAFIARAQTLETLTDTRSLIGQLTKTPKP